MEMRSLTTRPAKSLSTLAALALCGQGLANQFTTLDAAYQQSIYTGPYTATSAPTFIGTGQMVSRNGSYVNVYSVAPTGIHQGTPIRSASSTYVPGLNSSGAGMTTGLDGKVYTITSSGLQRFNPLNLSGGAQTLTTTSGQAYGITTMYDGRIAYATGGGSQDIYVYDPSNNTNTLIYTANTFIDGMTSDQSGNIALAGHGNEHIIIIKSNGTLLNDFKTPHFADGMTFGDGVYTGTLFSNNNDGTISKYRFGPGYSGTPSIVDIATGSQAYGDLATVGPDCAFYVTQFDNFGLNGSTAGVGTHWNNGVTNNEASVVRIGLKSGECGFYNPTEAVPEPASIAAIGLGIVGTLRKRRKV